MKWTLTSTFLLHTLFGSFSFYKRIYNFYLSSLFHFPHLLSLINLYSPRGAVLLYFLIFTFHTTPFSHSCLTYFYSLLQFIPFVYHSQLNHWSSVHLNPSSTTKLSHLTLTKRIDFGSLPIGLVLSVIHWHCLTSYGFSRSIFTHHPFFVLSLCSLSYDRRYPCAK